MAAVTEQHRQSHLAKQHHQHQQSRTFSFHSQKSHKSSGSRDLHESSAEKEARRLHSKADPTLAISELEPSVEAAMSELTMSPLRSIQHKDACGNPIADPDKSNPTRNRWERPLDTIRSFEAAIDENYSRKSVYRTETDSAGQVNRRSSYYGGNQPRFPQDTYYGNGRPASYRQENSQYDICNSGTSRNSHYDGYGGGYGAGPSRQRFSRQYTEPQYPVYGREQNIYPLPHKDRSYETVTSAAASGNSDQAGYQTDPTSSDNSSIDRPAPAKRLEPINDYGIGFSQSPSYQPQSFSVGVPGYGKPAAQPGVVPVLQQPPAANTAAPRKERSTLLRRASTQQSVKQAEPEKRKSWFARKFSKNS